MVAANIPQSVLLFKNGPTHWLRAPARREAATVCRQRSRKICPGCITSARGSVTQHLASLAAAAVLILSPASASANLLFEKNCAGCHAGGGNIVQAGATLFTGDLQKYGMLDPDGLYNLIYKGKGKMPGYGTDCAPRGQCTFAARLSDDEIRGLADYTLKQAASGWE